MQEYIELLTEKAEAYARVKQKKRRGKEELDQASNDLMYAIEDALRHGISKDQERTTVLQVMEKVESQKKK